MPEVDEREYDPEQGEEEQCEEEGDDEHGGGGEDAECVTSETPCFDGLFSRYDTGHGHFGTEHLGMLLLDMGFNCAPRVLDRALDEMDPDATGEISKLLFLEWFEANADEIDLPPTASSGSPLRGGTGRNRASPRGAGSGRIGTSHRRGDTNADGAADEAETSQFDDEKALTQLTSAMLDAKNDRKRAEADVQLLSNRLMHLQAEDARAQKRIEEANRRAKEIEAIQKRHADHQRAKQKALEQIQEQIQRTHDTNQLMAATSRTRKRQSVDAVSAMRAQIVQETRLQRVAHLDRIQQKKTMEHRQLSQKSKEIRSQEKLTVRKRDLQKQRYQKELLASARQKLATEHEQTLRHTKLIDQLEREEAQLIEKLRMSHELQRAAYEHLEFVIHDGENETE